MNYKEFGAVLAIFGSIIFFKGVRNPEFGGKPVDFKAVDNVLSVIKCLQSTETKE